MSENSTRAELAAAFRCVAAEFRRLPAEVQGRVDVEWNGVDDLLDRELLDGDRDTALAAISRWEDHWLQTFEEAVR
jgi:hypothetical protein